MTTDNPLSGTLVLDCSRMIPGAVAARMLMELGARLIKVEAPGIGDPLRGALPLMEGTGAGFHAFYRGAESLTLDLREAGGAAALRKLCKHADVLLESFRPGTMERWGLGAGRLLECNPALVVCSITGFGAGDPDAAIPGHDLNFTAVSGLLSLLPAGGLPRVPFSDVSGGLLASTAVLASLLERVNTGRGRHIEQPLAGSLLPFLTWALSDLEAGGQGLGGQLLPGNLPSYRLYECGDGKRVAVCALEPKFWDSLLELLGIEGYSDAALDPGPRGREAAERIQESIRSQTSDHWLEEARQKSLPLTLLQSLDEAAAVSGSDGAYIPSVGNSQSSPVPGLGEHTAKVLEEFGLTAK